MLDIKDDYIRRAWLDAEQMTDAELRSGIMLEKQIAVMSNQYCDDTRKLARLRADIYQQALEQRTHSLSESA